MGLQSRLALKGEEGDTGYRQLRVACPRQPGGERLQRVLRIHLLPPYLLLQQPRRLRGAVLRPGNVHSADGWEEFLEPIVKRYRETDKKLYLRGDAAFASPYAYEYLEDKGILYAVRPVSYTHLTLPTNREV